MYRGPFSCITGIFLSGKMYSKSFMMAEVMEMPL